MASPLFTLVIGYRNRDLAHVKRCLDSLQAQTFRDFTLLFVDYGSDAAQAAAARALVTPYDFVTYLYSDTRGRPWNRAQALNIGIRQAETPFVITTDIDMLFPPEFMAVVARRADAQHVLHCSPFFLPRGFDDWQRVTDYRQQFALGDKRQLGGFQCVPTASVQAVRGFDEFYRYWGLEDNDLKMRLEAQGLQIAWLNDETYFFHQWHPPANIYKNRLIPRSVWIHSLLHRQLQQGQAVRNDENWGRVIETEARAVFRYVQIEPPQLHHTDDIHYFYLDAPDRFPSHPEEPGRMAAQFGRLASGKAMAISHAPFPQSTRWGQRMVRYGNRLLRALYGNQTRLELAHNLLHEMVAEIAVYETLVADYYFNLPVDGGVSVLVRR